MLEVCIAIRVAKSENQGEGTTKVKSFGTEFSVKGEDLDLKVIEKRFGDYLKRLHGELQAE